MPVLATYTYIPSDLETTISLGVKIGEVEKSAISFANGNNI